jgi:hypothetical protein
MPDRIEIHVQNITGLESIPDKLRTRVYASIRSNCHYPIESDAAPDSRMFGGGCIKFAFQKAECAIYPEKYFRIINH